MTGFVARIVNALKPARVQASASTAMDARATTRPPLQTARGFCEALDQAMISGCWEQAERVADNAAPLAHQHPMLCERIARLRLKQNHPQRALDVIDACPIHTSSLRLLRTIALIQIGRRDEAHLDLREWARKAAAPLQARFLLAMFEWQSGDHENACQSLLKNIKQIHDPRSFAALMMLNAAQGSTEQAAYWAQRLQAENAWADSRPHLDLMLRSIGLPPAPQPGAIDDEHRVQTLATELLGAEETIAALVEAQRLSPDSPTTTLLAKAIERILSELVDRAAGYVALTNLHLLLDDRPAAMVWAHRGMKACPMSMALAQLTQDLQGADVVEAISQLLEKAA